MLPSYFEKVRREAEEQWNDMEKKGWLANLGPQFQSIQEPRLVISELLQNADDAEATEASARIINGTFVFDHTGNDFKEEEFRALCDFGRSSKRLFHTIGCWGTGFKCLFSIGDCVKLFTPTLSVCFHRNRFFVPCPIPKEDDTNGKTIVVVKIKNEHVEEDIRKRFEEWKMNPIPMLFFKHIENFSINEQKIQRTILETGPVPESQWMSLMGTVNNKYLLIKKVLSEYDDFVLSELKEMWFLRQEKIEHEFPPFEIDIVLGGNGMLHTVLPTGVETKLPFVCNAPFIPKPGRVGINSPAVSPTNKWLLNCVGELAASTMLNWLKNTTIETKLRAKAYDLFPHVSSEDTSLEGECGEIIKNSFIDTINGNPLLLTDQGDLVQEKKCIAIPKRLFDIWEAAEAIKFLDNDLRPALCRHVSNENRQKLRNKGLLEVIGQREFLNCLEHVQPPRPKSASSMPLLWSYISDSLESNPYYDAHKLHIIPAKCKEMLYAPSDVVWLGELNLQSENDKVILNELLNELDVSWYQGYFSKSDKDVSEKHENNKEFENNEKAYSLLSTLGLWSPSKPDKVIDLAAEQYFSQEDINLSLSVRLAQIAAKLDARTSNLKFFSQDMCLRTSSEGLIFDNDGNVEKFLPGASNRESKLLHRAYSKEFTSCSRDEWILWVNSAKAGLLTFVPLKKFTSKIRGEMEIKEEANKRGFFGNLNSKQYRTDEYIVNDWDFETLYWDHWKDMSEADEQFWTELAEIIICQQSTYWEKRTAQMFQVATTGTKGQLTHEELLPTWLLKLREYKCLPDTRGISCLPINLYRRTPETSVLLGIEPFISMRLDNASTSKLLELFGVHGEQRGSKGLLNHLRLKSKNSAASVGVIENIYRALDENIVDCSSDELQEIIEAFNTERIIYTQSDSWVTSNYVFRASEEILNVEVIRSSLQDLLLWIKLGIQEKPTEQHAIESLNQLRTGECLDKEAIRRIRPLLKGYSHIIWKHCNHWINLEGEWTKVQDLTYSINSKTLVSYHNLHKWVKDQTADFRGLSDEQLREPPFSRLTSLDEAIENQLPDGIQVSASPETLDWMMTVGAILSRIILETEEETDRVRSLANSLSRTTLYRIPEVIVTPNINGKCAGDPRTIEALWRQEMLYIQDLPKGILDRLIPNELGTIFDRTDIEGALHYCVDRNTDMIHAYLEQNFNIERLSDNDRRHEDAAEVIMEICKVKHQKPVSRRYPDTKPGMLSEERKIRQLFDRPKQSVFRDSLVEAYGSRCAITGCDIIEVLVAAHIIPVKDGGSDEVNNGILLRSDMHLLFDRGLIAIDSNNMLLCIDEKLVNSEYSIFEGKRVWIPKEIKFQPYKEFLDQHRKQAGI